MTKIIVRNIGATLIGARLKEERKRLQLTQTAFALIGGMSQHTLLRYENGTHPVGAPQLAAFATAGADVLYIITGRREPDHLERSASSSLALIPPTPVVPADPRTRKFAVVDVEKALDCGRGVADRKLAGVPYSMEEEATYRKRKVYALSDLPEDLRGRVEYYLVNGRTQPREISLLELPTAGPANLDAAIRAALNRALEKSPKSREHIASEMSQLVGRKVTKAMLDAFTAASRTSYRFPLALALAFEIATNSYALTRLLAKRRGGALLVENDIALVELARIERDKLALEHRAETIKSEIFTSDQQEQ